MGRDYLGFPQADAARRLCATCRHLEGFTPMTCWLFLDEGGHTRLCQPLRCAGGECGPEGALWEQAEATGAAVLVFPKAGRLA